MAEAQGLEEPGSPSSPKIPLPRIDQFAEVLSAEEDWCTLGTFLGASSVEVAEISDKYRSVSAIRCLIELYSVLEKKGKVFSWETIADVLRKMNNHHLANRVLMEYIRPQIAHTSPSSRYRDEHRFDVTVTDHVSIKGESVEELGREYCVLVERFTILTSKVKRAFRNGQVDLEELQDLVRDLCGIPSLPRDEATVDKIFDRMKEKVSILNFRVIVFLIEHLLKNEDNLLSELDRLKTAVDNFKTNTKLIEMVEIIKGKQVSLRGQKIVQLKVRDFWGDFSMKQFESAIIEIFETLYDLLSPLTVRKGCICVTWTMPDHVDALAHLPKVSLEFLRIIGVIYLHIGGKVVYNIEGDGCETIQAAMLQAIELKNTQAMNLLLAISSDLTSPSKLSPCARTCGDNKVHTIMKHKRICEANIQQLSCMLNNNLMLNV